LLGRSVSIVISPKGSCMKTRAWFRSTRSSDTLDAPAQREAAATSITTARPDKHGDAKLHGRVHGQMDGPMYEQMHDEMHALLDALPDGVLALDTSGRIQSCNAAAAALFGCAVHKLMGQRVANVLPALDALRQLADSAGEATSAQTHTLRARRLDGATFPLEVRWRRSSNHPAATAPRAKHLTLLVLRDVSQQPRFDRMQRDVVSVVSDALRTPLTSIRSALSRLADGSIGTLPADAQRIVHGAATDCERLVALVDDILATDKMSNGHQVMALRAHDLVKLLRENLRSTLGFARLHKVRLLMPGHSSPVWANVDAPCINQIMGKLLSNAIKFSPSGGDVSVHIDLTPMARPTHATIVVSDQGMGMPEHVRDGVFGRLGDADSSDHRAPSGMGLGLRNTHALVKRMGGTIMFECPTVGGTQFFVTFPLTPSPKDASDFALTGSQELRL
jgi:PAS domain S-box-containing protein